MITPQRHAFTVDFEDWYHGIPIAQEGKRVAEKRLHIGTEKLLALLSQHGARATFFMLEPAVREHPDLVRRIADAGHEIGSHGQSHDLIYEMSEARFREETRASVRTLEDFVGKKVDSYRAAYFSITRRSLWALDALAAEGIRYDSSIFPVKNWRYGIPDYPTAPQLIETKSGPLVEFPLPVRRLFGRNFPATGGAYFRLYPYALTASNIDAAAAQGHPLIFYIHPWELDPDHPFVRFKPQAMATHYARLRSTEKKLARLLADYRFTTLAEVTSDAFPRSRS